MSAVLCLSITFHDGRFHGRRDGDAPEWPPSPLRVFQAMVAAFAARGRENWLESARPALAWLEQLSPPVIIAPPTHLPPAYVIAVPNNDMNVPAAFWAKNAEPPREKQPSSLKSMKGVRPVCMDEGDTIHYLYALPEQLLSDVAAHLALIASAAQSITHVGWGVDMVAARALTIPSTEADALPGTRWKPGNDSGTPLRMPIAGTLDALVRRHRAVLQSVTSDGVVLVPSLREFATVNYSDADEINSRPVAAFDLLPVDPNDRQPRKSFRQERTVSVAAMLRHTASKAARDDLGDWRTPEWAKQFVAGHGPHDAAESFPRFSYVPVPTLDHADGMIRRVIIAETSGGDGRSARWAGRRLSGLPLVCADTKEEVAVLRHVEPSTDRVFDPYLLESDRWQTITPVILPGFDDNNRGKALKLLIKCFEQAGIPLDLIADCEMQKSPWSRASAQTRSYQRSKRLERLPAWHVRVFFKCRIAGPVAIGAGRHRGLGLMARME